MNLMKKVKSLCTPAYVYLVISVVGLVASMIQNSGNTTTYCLGSFNCDVPDTKMVFLGKAVYIALWTFVLQQICKSGYKSVSWFIVLIPFVLMATMLGMVIIRTM
jgi:hypothetical protein